jgi:hypothetical protein
MQATASTAIRVSGISIISIVFAAGVSMISAVTRSRLPRVNHDNMPGGSKRDANPRRGPGAKRARMRPTPTLARKTCVRRSTCCTANRRSLSLGRRHGSFFPTRARAIGPKAAGRDF